MFKEQSVNKSEELSSHLKKMGRLFQYNRFGATDGINKNTSKKDTQQKNKMVRFRYNASLKTPKVPSPLKNSYVF